MRIDKFLWTVRKYKTRSLATAEIRKDKVRINDELCKPSREVSVGDLVSYRKEGISFRLKVKDIPRSRVGAKLVENYIEETTSAEEIEKLEFLKMMRNFNRKKGDGRPTKKDRRDLDDFIEN